MLPAIPAVILCSSSSKLKTLSCRCPDHGRNAAVAVYLQLEYIADRIIRCPAEVVTPF